MAILEICQLKIKPHLAQTDPALLAALCTARTGLRTKVVDTQSRFYKCIEDPSLIYIIGCWPSLTRHKEFLASAQKSEILDSQDDLFDFRWIIHTEIEGGMDVIPLDAPILTIETFFIKKEDLDAYRLAFDKCLTAIKDETRPYKPFAAWRVDCDGGEFEHVIITGWRNEGEHTTSIQKTRQELPEYAVVMDQLEIKHMKDMEV